MVACGQLAKAWESKVAKRYLDGSLAVHITVRRVKHAGEPQSH
jgi:hypothetical protein